MTEQIKSIIETVNANQVKLRTLVFKLLSKLYSNKMIMVLMALCVI